MNAQIKTKCTCGKTLQAKAEHAGKRVKCPACGDALVIPASANSKIRVACSCGQGFKAKRELAGRKVKCPSCGEPLKVPSAPASEPAAVQSDAGLGDLSDLLDEVAAAPTAPKRLARNRESVEKVAPKKRRKAVPENLIDGLSLFVGIGCILHGLGGPAATTRGVWMAARILGVDAFMSIGGVISVAMVLAGLGFVACGVGVLMRQQWASDWAYLLSLIYVGLLVAHLGIPLISSFRFISNGAIPSMLLGMVKTAIPQLIVPSFIIYQARQS